MSTHRWRERPQPALREYFEEDGTGYYQHAHPQQGVILRHRLRELGYTDRLGDTAGHLRDQGELPHRVRQIRGGELQVILPRHPQKTCSSQIHGRDPLHLPAPQDAGQDRGTQFPWRPEEVVWLRPRGNRVCLDYACTRYFS
jgi:hypothetical protein